MSKENGGAAFPSPGVLMDDGRGGEYQQGAYEGMSLRDYFAAQILSGAMAKPGATVDIDGDYIGQNRAFTAYALADAMLKERAK